VVRTLEAHRGRHLTCGARRSVIEEVKNGLPTHKAPCDFPPGKGPRQGESSSLSLMVAVKREGPENRHDTSEPLEA
jgi:hypothetical protein